MTELERVARVVLDELVKVEREWRVEDRGHGRLLDAINALEAVLNPEGSES